MNVEINELNPLVIAIWEQNRIRSSLDFLMEIIIFCNLYNMDIVSRSNLVYHFSHVIQMVVNKTKT